MMWLYLEDRAIERAEEECRWRKGIAVLSDIDNNFLG
jgi:hypothetical protein